MLKTGCDERIIVVLSNHGHDHIIMGSPHHFDAKMDALHQQARHALLGRYIGAANMLCWCKQATDQVKIHDITAIQNLCKYATGHTNMSTNIVEKLSTDEVSLFLEPLRPPLFPSGFPESI